MQSHPVTITATRCYLGQIVVQVPDWLFDRRLTGIIRAGGATAAMLTRRVSFDRIAGTGLATCLCNSAKAGAQAQISLEEIAPYLRADGICF